MAQRIVPMIAYEDAVPVLPARRGLASLSLRR
jgi:hypothetical protein